jgi:hypothetical protein
MKRLAVSAAAVMALLLSAGTTIAADGGATAETIPMSFAPLTSETCSSLPAGTSITWSGTGQSITRIRTDAIGVTTIGNVTHAHGIAADQDGNTYNFNYTNTFRISNTLADPAVFSGPMVDSFSLAGQGPIRLHAGFVAIFTNDAGTFHFAPLHSFGDPIKFTDPWAHRCDPL